MLNKSGEIRPGPPSPDENEILMKRECQRVAFRGDVDGLMKCAFRARHVRSVNPERTA